MSDAEMDRVASALVAACDREAAAKERAAAMERRAEAAEAAWAAGREELARAVARTSAIQERLDELELDYAATLRRCGEIRDAGETAQARLDAVLRVCDEEWGTLEGRWFVLVHEVRAAATGTEPEPEVDG